MPNFRKSGDNKFDFWLIDNSPVLSVIPANTIQGISIDTKIVLQVGNKNFGETHISHRHGHWLRKHQTNGCVATFVHKKLSGSGRILRLDDEKTGLALTVHPSAALILKHFEEYNYFSVTTIYYKERLAGEEIGRYIGHQWATNPHIRRD